MTSRTYAITGGFGVLGQAVARAVQGPKVVSLVDGTEAAQLTTAQLQKLNPQVKNLNRINVGQLIHLQLKRHAPAPKTTTYTVRSGDTFSGIATSHHLTVAALAKLNPQVANLNLISVGQKLKLKAAPSPTPARRATRRPS